MPIEFERKYVLFNNQKTTNIIKQKIKSYAGGVWGDDPHLILHIHQHYIQKGKDWAFRVRESITSADHMGCKNSTYTATFKQDINGTTREIESVIDESDYLELITIAKSTVKKIRYLIEDEYRWEVDFFYNESPSPYFIMAEVELEIFGQEISNMPDFIQDNLLYEVPLDDHRFANIKLHDIEYVEKEYNKLLKDNNNEKQKEI